MRDWIPEASILPATLIVIAVVSLFKLIDVLFTSNQARYRTTSGG